MDTLFRLSNLLVLPFWALMILVPRWRWTQRIMRSPLVIAAPACLYLLLVLPRLAEVWPAIARPTLTGIAQLLGSRAGATIAWFHFLAFDLFVGRCIYLEGQQRMSVWFVSPILFLTLMLGPVGLLLFLFLRVIARSNFETQDETRAGQTSPQGASANLALIARRTVTLARKSLARSFAMNGPLTISGLLMLLTFVATLVGLLVDHRVITGAPAWLKPAKFAISISVYCFTLVWLLRFVENRQKLVRLIANVTVTGLLVEMAIIVAQAARGTTSHFNLSTPVNAALWTAMGAFIVLVWSMAMLLALLLTLQRMPDRAFALSLRLGVFICAVGMAVAFLMTRPTNAQLATVAAHGPRIIGAHSVGIADGGPGLPIVGWSTTGGDLRVAHFVGLHALQVLPLVGWFSTRRRGLFGRFAEGQRLGLVWTAGIAYLGAVLLLTWQALRAQSLIQPDSKTLFVAGLLALGVAVAVGLITVRSRVRKHAQRLVSKKPIPISGETMSIIISVLVVALLTLPVGSFASDGGKSAQATPSVETQTVGNDDSSHTVQPATQPLGNSLEPGTATSPAQPVQNGNGLRVSQKFRYYASETYFNPAAITGPVFRAAIRMASPPGKGATGYPREWRQGPEAFGRNFGDAVGQRVSFTTARFVSGMILREDPRYLPSSSRNVFGRSLHALSFTFIDRSDFGRCRPALANFVGAVAGGFVGNTYLPRGFNDLTHAGQRSAFQLGFFAGGNLFREFAPQMPVPLRTLFMLIGR